MLRASKWLTFLIALPAVLFVLAPAQEGEKKTALPIKDMVKAVSGQAALGDKSFYYDPGFKAVGSFAVHNHFAQRVCLGYLVSDGTTLSYRYIRAWPGLGSSNDAFQTPLTNVTKVEYKYYKSSKGLMDSYPERLSTTIYFKTPIKGLMADWTKEDMKFDIWDVSFGYALMGFFEDLKIPLTEKG